MSQRVSHYLLCQSNTNSKECYNCELTKDANYSPRNIFFFNSKWSKYKDSFHILTMFHINEVVKIESAREQIQWELLKLYLNLLVQLLGMLPWMWLSAHESMRLQLFKDAQTQEFPAMW